MSEQDAHQMKRMHQFAYGIKKAGMQDVNEDKMAQLMQNTKQNDTKYFSKQEKKMSNQDEKIK